MGFVGLNLAILGALFPQLVYRKILEKDSTTPSFIIEKQVAFLMAFYGISLSLSNFN